MLYGNGFGFGFVLHITLAAAELGPACRYFASSPLAAALLLLRSLAFYAGALLYTKLLKEFGAVTAVGVTTVRKILTVALSFLVFPKPWSAMYGWGGAAFVLAVTLEYHARRKRGGPPPASGAPPAQRRLRDHDDEGAPLRPAGGSG